MKTFLYRASLMLLLAIFLLAAACWLSPDRVLNQVARPLVETAAARLFGAEVRIGRLSRTAGGLEIRALSVSVPQSLLATLPRLELSFSLASLWQRRLGALQVDEPRVEIILAPQQGASPGGVPQLPDRLPLTIERLTVSGGRLLISGADRRWQLHQLNVTGALQRESDFRLFGFFGEDEQHPVALSGSAQWSPQPSLTLETLCWQNRQLLTAPLPITLGGSGWRLGRGAFHLDRFDHRQLQGVLKALGLPSPLPEDLTFSLTDASVLLVPTERPRFEVQVAGGRIGRGGVTGTFTELTAAISAEQDGWVVTGRLQGPAETSVEWSARSAGDQRLSGQFRLDSPEPERLAAELFGAAPLPISGGLQLVGEYALSGDRLNLTTDLHGRADGRSTAGRFDIGQLDGSGRLVFSAGREQLNLGLQLASQPFLSVAGDFRRLNFSLAPTSLSALKRLLAPGLVPDQLRAASALEADGQLFRDAGRWTAEIRLSAAELVLPDLVLHGIAGRSRLRFLSGRIVFEDAAFDLALARGETLNARLEVRGAGRLSPQKFSLSLQRLSLTQLNYASLDGQAGIADAALELRGTVAGLRPEGALAVDLTGSFAAGEVLRGAFYADLSAYRGEVSLSGAFRPGSRRLTLDSVKIDIPQLASMTAAGRFGPDRISVRGRVESADLAASYGELLGPLLRDFKPALAGLTLAGGLALDGNLLWQPDRWQSDGTLRLTALTASWPGPRLDLVDATGAIPFALSSGPAAGAATAGAAAAGEVTFEMLSVGPASLERGRLDLAAVDNRISLRSPLIMQLAGGRLAIEQLSLGRSEGTPQGSADIAIADVELEALTEQLGLPVMQGTFSAELGTIRYGDRQLSSDGLALIEVFGGRIQLRNMRYRDPFSGYPRFDADLDFSGLDLLQATRTFDFGEMNGLIDGHIHGLQLFGGTPAAFDAALASRPRGKRNISVKALKNLSILSQGGIASVLSRGIYRFIDFYRYRTLGFKCSLENDIFTLVGTARPGSDRYLVHGGLLPPRIDIITSTPTISFREMIDRLGRIDRAGG